MIANKLQVFGPNEVTIEWLEQALSNSGIKAEIMRFDVRDDEIGASYLKHAKEVNADMLIKGAYARSRVRQMLLGGRTRHIITATEIPVLLCK